MPSPHQLHPRSSSCHRTAVTWGCTWACHLVHPVGTRIYCLDTQSQCNSSRRSCRSNHCSRHNGICLGCRPHLCIETVHYGMEGNLQYSTRHATLLTFTPKINFQRNKSLFWLTASLLIGIISTVIFVITFQLQIEASLSIGTSKLVQSTRHPRTTLFILSTPTVQISVTFLLLWHTQIRHMASIHRCLLPFWRWPTVNVVLQTLPICCLLPYFGGTDFVGFCFFFLVDGRVREEEKDRKFNLI